MNTWIINEQDWSLPVAVAWPDEGDMVNVHLDRVPLLKIQVEALEKKLATVGSKQMSGWWLMKSQLDEIAHPCAGDPEREVIWRPGPAPRFKPGVDDGFIKSYCRTGLISDPAQAALVFHSFTRHMLSWLLNEQRPVNLGFAELLPVPLRANWLTVLHQKNSGKFSSKKSEWRKITAAPTPEKLFAFGAADTLIDPQLFAWCRKDEHLYWSIHTRPKKMWWRMVKAVEMEKKKRLRLAYYKNSVNTVKHHLPKLIETYASFLQQVCLPFLRLATGSHRWNKKARFRAVSRASYLAPAETVSGAAVHDVKRGAAPGPVLDDLSTVALLSAVPPLQRAALDMRDARESVFKEKLGGDGHPGPDHVAIGIGKNHATGGVSL